MESSVSLSSIPKVSNQKAILSVKCREKKELIEHKVYPVYWDMDSLKKVWELSKEYDILFTDEIRGDFEKFISTILVREGDKITSSGLFWRIDDFLGLMKLDRIQPEIDAFAHITFFDGRLNGRHTIVQEMLKYVFKKYNFRRITIEIPDYPITYLRMFIMKSGFRQEGKRRNIFKQNGRFIDGLLYGILREEILKDAAEH